MPKSDRTSTGTRSLFGAQLRYDRAAGFPLIITKAVHFKSVAYELLGDQRADTRAPRPASALPVVERAPATAAPGTAAAGTSTACAASV